MDSYPGSYILFRMICSVLLVFALVCTASTPTEAEENWRRVDSVDSKTGSNVTKVAVVGNTALVPVTLLYKGNEVDVLLLLDTGSSRTVVSAETADRLDIDLSEARKMRLQVVGGALIEARQVRLSSITIGPHARKNADILVVDHQGPPVKHDGLLGMDLLRGLKYRIDLEEQVIRWD